MGRVSEFRPDPDARGICSRLQLTWTKRALAVHSGHLNLPIPLHLLTIRRDLASFRCYKSDGITLISGRVRSAGFDCFTVYGLILLKTNQIETESCYRFPAHRPRTKEPSSSMNCLVELTFCSSIILPDHLPLGRGLWRDSWQNLTHGPFSFPKSLSI